MRQAEGTGQPWDLDTVVRWMELVVRGHSGCRRLEVASHVVAEATREIQYGAQSNLRTQGDTCCDYGNVQIQLYVIGLYEVEVEGVSGMNGKYDKCI